MHDEPAVLSLDCGRPGPQLRHIPLGRAELPFIANPMRQPVRFSDAPHHTRPLDVLLAPLVYVANVTVAGWLYPVWRTARIRWDSDVAELIRLFTERSRPIICFAWHAYELLSICAFRDFPRDVTPLAIGHDGAASRALQQSASWFGFQVWAYRRRSPTSPRTQLIDLLKAERPIIGLFPDSGGPDGVVRPGLLEAARAAEALLVPMAWHSRPVVVVGRRQRYCFPVPFSRITVFYAQPLDSAQATLDDCRDALEGLERRIRASSSEAQ